MLSDQQLPGECNTQITDSLGFTHELNAVLNETDAFLLNESFRAFSNNSIWKLLYMNSNILYEAKANTWNTLNASQQSEFLALALEHVKSMEVQVALQHTQSLLYIVTGCFKEMSNYSQQIALMNRNTALFIAVTGFKCISSAIGFHTKVILDACGNTQRSKHVDILHSLLLILSITLHSQANNPILPDDSNILVILVTILPLIGNEFKTSNITKTILIDQLICLMHACLWVGYTSAPLLHALKASQRSTFNLSTSPAHRSTRCFPSQAHQLLTILSARYPGYILPTASDVCNQDVWIGNMPHSFALKRACEYGAVDLEYAGLQGDEYPIGVKETLETISRTLHIPLSSVQIAETVKQFIFEKEHGSKPNTTHDEQNDPLQTKSESDSHQRVRLLYKTILPLLKALIGSITRILYYANNKNERLTINQKEINRTISNKCACLILSLLKLFKSYHFFAFDHLTRILLENNGILLCLKVICNWVPERKTIIKVNDDANVFVKREVDPDFLYVKEGHVVNKLYALCSEYHEYQMYSNINLLIAPITPLTLESLTLLPPVLCEQSLQSMISILSIIQKLSKDSVVRLESLVTLKSMVILKRFLNLPYRKELCKRICKLIRPQIRNMGTRWRQISTNMNIISTVYKECGLDDDWNIDRDERELEQGKVIDESMNDLRDFWNLKEFGFNCKLNGKVDGYSTDFDIIREDEVEFEKEFQKLLHL